MCMSMAPNALSQQVASFDPTKYLLRPPSTAPHTPPPQTAPGGDVYSAPTPTYTPPSPPPETPTSPPPVAPPTPVLRAAENTVGQSLGLNPNDPRFNLKEGDQYAGGIVSRNPNGGFTIAADNMSGPLAGTSYGHYFNTQGDGFTGTRDGKNYINGNLYTGEGLNQDNGAPNPDSAFNTYARQAAAAFAQAAPGASQTQNLQGYLSSIGNPATGGNPSARVSNRPPDITKLLPAPQPQRYGQYGSQYGRRNAIINMLMSRY